MATTTAARTEREALCDLFLEVGPDVPTLCEGWTARDLATHLIVRERRPDALAGEVIKPLAGHAEKVRVAETERPWPEIVERVRSGPPKWNPTGLAPVESFVNTIEYFVHHEDVRRAQPGWTARSLSPDMEDALAAPLKRMGGLLTRKAKVGIVLEPEGREAMRLRKGEPTVTLRGPLGELVLYVYGRKDVAEVTLDGPADAVERVRTADFGI
jgi:uncharacterized protein (TIGR03085 family)